MSQTPNQDQLLAVVIREEGQSESSNHASTPEQNPNLIEQVEKLMQPLDAQQLALLQQCKQLNAAFNYDKVIELLENADFSSLYPEIGLELCFAIVHHNNYGLDGGKELWQKTLNDLLSIQTFYQQNFRWNLLVAFAYLGLERPWLAKTHFEYALKLKPGDDEATLFLNKATFDLSLPRFIEPFHMRVQKMWSTFMQNEAAWRAKLQNKQNQTAILEEISKVVHSVSDHINIDLTLKYDSLQPRWQLIFELNNNSTMLFILDHLCSDAPSQLRSFWDFQVGQPQNTITTVKHPESTIDLRLLRFKLVNPENTRDFDPFGEVKGLQPTPDETDDHIAFGEPTDETPIASENTDHCGQPAANSVNCAGPGKTSQTGQQKTLDTPGKLGTPGMPGTWDRSGGITHLAKAQGHAQGYGQTPGYGQGSERGRSRTASTSLSLAQQITAANTMSVASRLHNQSAALKAAKQAELQKAQAQAQTTLDDQVVLATPEDLESQLNSNSNQALDSALNQGPGQAQALGQAQGQAQTQGSDKSPGAGQAAGYQPAQGLGQNPAQAPDATQAKNNAPTNTALQPNLPLNALPKSLPKNLPESTPKFSLCIYYPQLSTWLLENEREPSLEYQNAIQDLVRMILLKINMYLGECALLSSCVNFRFMGYKTRFEHSPGPSCTLEEVAATLEEFGYKHNLSAKDYIQDFARVDYEFENPVNKPTPLRGDIFKGYSLLARLNLEYYTGQTNLINLLQIHGICSGFIAYDRSESKLKKFSNQHPTGMVGQPGQVGQAEQLGQPGQLESTEQAGPVVSSTRQDMQLFLTNFLNLLPNCQVTGAAYGSDWDYIDFISYGDVAVILAEVQTLFHKVKHFSNRVLFSPFRQTPCSKLYEDTAETGSDHGNLASTQSAPGSATRSAQSSVHSSAHRSTIATSSAPTLSAAPSRPAETADLGHRDYSLDTAVPGINSPAPSSLAPTTAQHQAQAKAQAQQAKTQAFPQALTKALTQAQASAVAVADALESALKTQATEKCTPSKRKDTKGATKSTAKSAAKGAAKGTTTGEAKGTTKRAAKRSIKGTNLNQSSTKTVKAQATTKDDNSVKAAIADTQQALLQLASISKSAKASKAGKTSKPGKTIQTSKTTKTGKTSQATSPKHSSTRKTKVSKPES